MIDPGAQISHQRPCKNRAIQVLFLVGSSRQLLSRAGSLADDVTRAGPPALGPGTGAGSRSGRSQAPAPPVSTGIPCMVYDSIPGHQPGREEGRKDMLCR